MRRLAPIATLALFVAACTYDWSFDAGVDAGGDVRVEAGPDASPDVARPPDTGVDAPSDAPADVAPPDATSSCDADLAAVNSARAAAKSCQPTSVCSDVVKDACGCDDAVAGSGALATAYVNAVAAFNAAGCQLPSCSPCSTFTSGLCVVADASGPSYACQNP